MSTFGHLSGQLTLTIAGNAVTPPAARDLVTILAESMGVAA